MTEYTSNKKEARFAGLFRLIVVAWGRASTGTAMPVMTCLAAAPEPDRLQLDVGNAGRDVQTGLALQADRLQRVGIFRATDQEVAAEADADRGVGANAALTDGEVAASHPPGRRVHRPDQPGLVGEAEIDAVAANGCEVGFGTAAFALEHAFE